MMNRTRTEYTFKNIARESLFMFVVQIFVGSIGSSLSPKLVLFSFIASILFGVLSIRYYRYLDKKGKLYGDPAPKFGHKTWKEHQEDKKLKSKDA